MFYVYDSDKMKRGTFDDLGDALMFVGMMGESATVRYGRTVVWVEGEDGVAATSYDETTRIILGRMGVRQVHTVDVGDNDSNRLNALFKAWNTKGRTEVD